MFLTRLRAISRMLAGLLLLSAAVFAAPANATILFAGNEDIAFLWTGGFMVVGPGSSSTVRTAFSRASITCNNCTSTADPPASRAATTPFTPTSSLWFHAMWANNNGNGTIANATMMRMLDGGTARILVRGTGTAGQVKISTRNAAGTITDLATSAAGAFGASGAPQQIDLHVNYAVSGSVTLYFNGAVIVTYSGDVTTDGATTLNQGDISGIRSGATQEFWSEIIAADTDTRSMAFLSLAPQAAGNTQSWTPNTVGNVNPTTINDANFVSTTGVRPWGWTGRD